MNINLFSNHYLISPQNNLHSINKKIKIYTFLILLLIVNFASRTCLQTLCIIYIYFILNHLYLIKYLKDFCYNILLLFIYYLIYKYFYTAMNLNIYFIKLIILTFCYIFTLRILFLTTKFEQIIIILFDIIYRVSIISYSKKKYILFISCFSYQFLDKVICQYNSLKLSIKIKKLNENNQNYQIFFFVIKKYFYNYYKLIYRIIYNLYIKQLNISNIFLHNI
uniref:Transmembrane protein n=1 Tax=Crouania attenuata TaxID=42002 RepID=A0A4D6WV48_9FLOR|nr:hypothetical protein [Crouania attenuata]